ncbi:MAG: hypothetical protein GY838_05785 [bacterium]|nr:hypothetical protein [bacterium]
MRTMRYAIILSLLVFVAVPAAAQTPPAACAADSLYLFSPDEIDIRLQERGRVGVTLSWPTLDLLQSTCFTLRGADTLNIDTSVDGGFGDRVDRLLRFTVSGDGDVGAAQVDPLYLNWRNEGPSTYGNLAGSINLTNNGGLLNWDQSAGGWVQINDGFPRYWRQTNVVALAAFSRTNIYAAITSGSAPGVSPEGLYHYFGGTWTRLAPDTFDESILISDIVVDDTDANNVAVATERYGLFVSTDGGGTFTQYTSEFDAGFPSASPYRVDAVDWTGGRLITSLADFGVFISTNAGSAWTRSPFVVPHDLDAQVYVDIQPTVSSFTVDPTDQDHILAALLFHGLYESMDGGATWTDLYGDLVVPDDGDPVESGAWVTNGLSVTVNPLDPQVMVLAVAQVGLFRTANGGANWVRVGEGVQPANLGLLRRSLTRFVDDVPGRVIAVEDEWSILVSDDAGLTWNHMTTQPLLSQNLALHVLDDGSGDFLVGSWGGGTFEAGTTLHLSDTYSSGTSLELRELDLGLDVTFAGGTLAEDEAFDLVCQTYQGWAVWRSTGDDSDDMTLVGLYDRVNPEACIEGYCGNINFEPVASCFAAKRAACFDFSTQDTVRFFDEEIYNGFAYYYAVSAFDYGNTALLAPANNTNTLLFSPRWDEDAQSVFDGPGNRKFERITFSAAATQRDEEIFVYPNPLRNDAGLPGEEGQTVVFTNLPPDSHIRVFTTAGDDVADLPSDLQEGGQIRWRTVNHDQEPVAPGVYLYKVIMPERDAYWGRLVVIR